MFSEAYDHWVAELSPEDRVAFLLRLTPASIHWRLDDHLLTPEEEQQFRECTADDFQIALAILEAAMTGVADKVIGQRRFTFFGGGVSRLRNSPRVANMLQAQQEEQRYEILNVAVRLESLRTEARRRWPNHAKHGHWWHRHDVPND